MVRYTRFLVSVLTIGASLAHATGVFAEDVLDTEAGSTIQFEDSADGANTLPSTEPALHATTHDASLTNDDEPLVDAHGEPTDASETEHAVEIGPTPHAPETGPAPEVEAAPLASPDASGSGETGFCRVRSTWSNSGPLWPPPSAVATREPQLAPFLVLPDLTPETAQPGLFDTFKTVETAPKVEADDKPQLSAGEAIKSILGLLVLLALAYIAGHPAVQRVEERLRISQIVTAGFPFVIFGAIASSENVGILSPPVMEAIAPLLPVGLGWIGFAIGIRYTLTRPTVDMRPVVEAFVLTTFIPFGMIVGAASIGLAIAGGGIDEGAAFLRDALILATAGAMTAKGLPSLIERLGASSVPVERMRHIIQLEEIAAFAGLIMVAAFFRPDEADVGWHLPSVGWVFVTIGIGSALGAVTFASLGTISGATETMVVMLGSICFAAGISSYLRLSPIVVCFLAGVLLSNLPGQWKQQVRDAVSRLERPIYLIFLLIAGALWPIGDWQGWVLMGLFVAARTGGRFISVRVLSSRQPGVFSPLEQRNLAASPMGALSIAIVMTAQDLYSGPSVAWIVTAILGGAIVTEFITQISAFATYRLFPDQAAAVVASGGTVTASVERDLPGLAQEAEPDDHQLSSETEVVPEASSASGDVVHLEHALGGPGPTDAPSSDSGSDLDLDSDSGSEGPDLAPAPDHGIGDDTVAATQPQPHREG